MRIVIADDQKRTRQSLRALLSTSFTRPEIWEAPDGDEALRLVEEVRPHIVVMDIRMPGVDGIAATRVIKERWPTTKVLALSMYPERQQEARDAGADLFVGKGEPPERLLEAVASLM